MACFFFVFGWDVLISTLGGFDNDQKFCSSMFLFASQDNYKWQIVKAASFTTQGIFHKVWPPATDKRYSSTINFLSPNFKTPCFQVTACFWHALITFWTSFYKLCSVVHTNCCSSYSHRVWECIVLETTPVWCLLFFTRQIVYSFICTQEPTSFLTSCRDDHISAYEQSGWKFVISGLPWSMVIPPLMLMHLFTIKESLPIVPAYPIKPFQFWETQKVICLNVQLHDLFALWAWWLLRASYCK